VPVVPHDLVQVDQAPNAVVAQCVAHSCVPHSSVSAVCGHASPPKLGPACARVRDLEPPPHDLVQADQSLSPAAQSVMVQSSGHAWSLQARVSSRYGHK
jgi:hypothetical protein